MRILALRGLGLLLLSLLVLLLLMPALAWILWPRLALPLAAQALDGTGVRLIALTSDRPTGSGLHLPHLVVALDEPSLQLTLSDVDLRWDPGGKPGLLDGHLTAIRIAHLEVDLDAGTAAPAGSPSPAAAPSPADLLPGALRAALPVDRLEIAELALRMRLAGTRLTGSGHLDLGPARLEIALQLASSRLAGPVRLTGRLTDDDRLLVQLEDADGKRLLDADTALAAHGTGLVLSGGIDFDLRRLGSVAGLDLPAAAGRLQGALTVDRANPSLRLDPGTTVVADLPVGTGNLHATLQPDAPVTLALEAARLSSSAPLPILFRLEGATRADGRIDLLQIAGTTSAPAARLAATGTLASGPLSSAWSLTGRLAMDADGAPTLDPGATLTLRALRIDADTGVDRLRIHTLGPLHYDPAAPQRIAPVPIRIDAGSARFAGRTLALGDCSLDLTPSLAADRLDVAFHLAGPGLGASGTLQQDLVRGSGALQLDDARTALTPDGLAAAAWGPGWPARRGTLELSGRLQWPPSAGTGVQARLRLDGAAFSTAGIAFDGIDLDTSLVGGRARLDAPDLALSIRTLDLRAASQPLRIAGLEAHGAVAVQVADPAHVDLIAAAAAPGRLGVQVDDLDLRLARAVTDGYAVDGLRVRGGLAAAMLDAPAGRSAHLHLTADGADVGVPLDALACDIALAGNRVDLSACATELLGGRIQSPAAHFDLASGDGYAPIAINELDLGATLALMQDAALDGAGTLDGAVPLRLEAGRPVIVDGYLGARPPGGTLRYASDASLRARLNQPGIALALLALQDFRYQRLGAGVDYAADGTLTLGVRLSGANPDVEGGRRIDFNLNVTQNLPRLLQSLRLSQNIGGTLERRLQERIQPR